MKLDGNTCVMSFLRYIRVPDTAVSICGSFGMHFDNHSFDNHPILHAGLKSNIRDFIFGITASRQRRRHPINSPPGPEPYAGLC